MPDRDQLAPLNGAAPVGIDGQPNAPVPDAGPNTVEKKVIPYAEKSIIYIPGLGQDVNNSAAQVGHSIARTLDRRTAGSVTMAKETPEAPQGLKAVCTLIDDREQRLFDLYELDYRDRLENLDRTSDGKEGTAPSWFVIAIYTVKAIVIYFFAITRADRKYKSGYVKAQLALGMVGVLVMIVAAVFLIGTALLAVLAQYFPVSQAFKDWLDPSGATQGFIVLGFAISGASYLKFRKDIIRAARRLIQLMNYCQNGAQGAEVSSAVADGVDALRDLRYRGDIHLIAYSFGSLVLLDELIPRSRAVVTRHQWVHDVKSITTIGCPVDFLRLYLPDYFTDRHALLPDLPWQNIFIASDLFGSNFVRKADIADQDRRTMGAIDRISGERKNDSVPGGMTVSSTEYLRTKFGVWNLITQTALRQHDRYWTMSAGCWDIAAVIVGRPASDAAADDAGVPVGEPAAGPTVKAAAVAVTGSP